MTAEGGRAAGPAAPGAAAPPRGQATAQAMKVVEATEGLAKGAGREDLQARLEGARARLRDPAITALVVGEYKQGKSSLVNALLGVKVCPVDDDVATAVPTRVQYAKTASAAIVTEGGPGHQPRVEAVPLDQVASYVTEQGRAGNGKRVDSAVVALPHPLLSTGLVLVDTPGVGGLGASHTAATMAVLPTAEAVLLVSDASQEYTAPEIEFLRTARGLCPTVLCVMTKIDLYHEWRRIHEIDKGHLARAGINARIVPVSSTVRQVAVARKDAAMNQESGFPALLGILQQEVVAVGEQLAVRAACADAGSVLAQLELALVSEARALKDPEAAGEEVARLKEAKEEAGRLRGMSARWQTTMGDGFSDLTSDMDFDFRRRVRDVTAEAEGAIEEGDPGQLWDEFDAWLKRRTAADVGEHFAMMATGVEEIARRTADHFEGVADRIDEAAGMSSPAAEIDLGEVSRVEGPRLNIGSQGMNALRTAYSSFSMFGMLGNYAGLAMINPFAIAASVLMAGKAVRDERQKQLGQRRQQAKAAVRKYLDELTFQIGKDSRDAARHAQRQVRDFFLGRVDEMERSITEAIASSQDAVKRSDAERQTRLKQLQEGGQRIVAIRKAVAALAPGMEQAPAS